MTLFGLQNPKVNESLGGNGRRETDGRGISKFIINNISKPSFVPAEKHTQTPA